MAQAGKGRLNYRCPSCFMRDLDMDMFYDKDKDEYYCLRCQYRGNEADVLAKNELARFRYGAMKKRFTDFEARFFDRDGREGDALRILALSGVDLVRLRLWHDPYSETGEPYGGGTCDLTRVTDMARRVRALGLDWMLSFHYSDFWTDPGKQNLPKAWRGLDQAALERALRLRYNWLLDGGLFSGGD